MIKAKKNKNVRTGKTVLILDNVRSVLNVGSIFRTSDAVGISKIYLVGITPSPIDRFGRKRNDLHKSALGAEESVLWEVSLTPESVIENLKKENFKIISLEQSKDSIDYKELGDKISDGENIALVLGNEVSGVSKAFLDNSDFIAEIPMVGEKESLNVSVSAGIFIYRILNI